MRFGFNKSRVVPSAKLQIVICQDGTIGMVQPRPTAGVKFSLKQLQMIAAFSSGDIKDMKRGLDAYLKRAGLDPEQQEQCRKLAVKLYRQKRLVSHEGKSADKAAPASQPDISGIELPEGTLALHTPCGFVVRDGGFQAITHDGAALPPISSVELHALSRIAVHDTLDAALEAHRQEVGEFALDKQQFIELLKSFIAIRFVAGKRDVSMGSTVELGVSLVSGEGARQIQEAFRDHAAQQDAAEAEREAETGRHRPRVIPVAFGNAIPAGLGAVMAYAKSHDGGVLDEFYNFRTDWYWDPERVPQFTAEPAIYLFSNYLWSHKQCIEVSALVKKLSPNSITIHGGPDTPRYEGDERGYFEQFEHIDVTVRGEGEVTLAEVLSKLRDVIGDENPDLGVLEGVAGATYRSGDGIVRNPDRERVTDINMLPSAYLTGLFDAYMGLEQLYLILETNRGCPYGCTFCDWGAATASKIRKFDEDRVMDEIAWASKAKAAVVTIADANFGIFPRDVDFAREAARLKNATGYPKAFGGNYAKNTVQYLRNIIDVLAEGNILTLGTLSLQTMDDDTLNVINRSNIKTEKYDALAVEMRNADLPLAIELMMGLPGATVASFREDLQQCIDRELPVRLNMTTMLVNSPMNHPDYLKTHEIKLANPVAPGNNAILASTASYTEEDMNYMNTLKEVYVLFENFGVLRILSRYVHQETGMEEMHFYEKLMDDAAKEDDWPILHLLCFAVPGYMAPPVSWFVVIEELGRYLEQKLGIQDSPARRSALAAQLACLPAFDRNYPEQVELECDVSAWFDAILEAKTRGNRRDWINEVPPLASFSTGKLTVDDPDGVTATSLGISSNVHSFGLSWELDSPLHRARIDLS